MPVPTGASASPRRRRDRRAGTTPSRDRHRPGPRAHREQGQADRAVDHLADHEGRVTQRQPGGQAGRQEVERPAAGPAPAGRRGGAPRRPVGATAATAPELPRRRPHRPCRDRPERARQRPLPRTRPATAAGGRWPVQRPSRVPRRRGPRRRGHRRGVPLRRRATGREPPTHCPDRPVRPPRRARSRATRSTTAGQVAALGAGRSRSPVTEPVMVRVQVSPTAHSAPPATRHAGRQDGRAGSRAGRSRAPSPARRRPAGAAPAGTRSPSGRRAARRPRGAAGRPRGAPPAAARPAPTSDAPGQLGHPAGGREVRGRSGRPARRRRWSAHGRGHPRAWRSRRRRRRAGQAGSRRARPAVRDVGARPELAGDTGQEVAHLPARSSAPRRARRRLDPRRTPATTATAPTAAAASHGPDEQDDDGADDRCRDRTGGDAVTTGGVRPPAGRAASRPRRPAAPRGAARQQPATGRRQEHGRRADRSRHGTPARPRTPTAPARQSSRAAASPRTGAPVGSTRSATRPGPARPGRAGGSRARPPGGDRTRSAREMHDHVDTADELAVQRRARPRPAARRQRLEPGRHVPPASWRARCRSRRRGRC